MVSIHITRWRIATFNIERRKRSWRPAIWLGLARHRRIPTGLCLYTPTRMRGFDIYRYHGSPVKNV